MKIGEAWAIFQNIRESRKSDEEKGLAILMVCNAETHNSITKTEMMDVIRYLLPLAFDIPEPKKERVGE